MNATVAPLARNGDQLQDLLADIALGRGGASPDLTNVVPALAWHGHTRQSVTAAWDDFRQAVRAREALATGTRTWQEFYEPEDCASFDHAIDLKTTEVDDAYRILVYGPRHRPAITDGAAAYGEVGSSPAVIHLDLSCRAAADCVDGLRAFRVDTEALAMIASGRLVACKVCTAGGAR